MELPAPHRPPSSACTIFRFDLCLAQLSRGALGLRGRAAAASCGLLRICLLASPENLLAASSLKLGATSQRPANSACTIIQLNLRLGQLSRGALGLRGRPAAASCGSAQDLCPPEFLRSPELLRREASAALSLRPSLSLDWVVGSERE